MKIMTAHELMKDFLENCPPYKPYNYESSLHIGHLTALSFYPKLEITCLTCGKEKTFFPSVIKSFESPDVISIKYSCSQCSTTYTYCFIRSSKSYIKIGQFPSFADLSHKKSEKYKKVLPKYYIEYKKSLSAYSQGMGVASFVYLRRILEDLVEKKYEKLSNKEDKARFIDKLKAVQKHEEIIPPEIEEIKSSLYSVLSKRVHEYSEEECLAVYDSVNFIIELILDKELEAKARTEKIKSATQAIKDKLSTPHDSTN